MTFLKLSLYCLAFILAYLFLQYVLHLIRLYKISLIVVYLKHINDSYNSYFEHNTESYEFTTRLKTLLNTTNYDEFISCLEFFKHYNRFESPDTKFATYIKRLSHLKISKSSYDILQHLNMDKSSKHG